MDSTTLTVLIAVAFLILAVVTSFISARVGQRSEPELIDFPGSGLLIKPRRKKERFSPEWWSNWIQGLSTELVGAAIATLLIGVVVGTVQKNEADESLKRQLIIQMGSPDNGFAVEAVRQLRSLGWLEDGSLRGANLLEANLQKGFLRDANLQNVVLSGANMQYAFLFDANLQNAVLRWVNLQNAFLTEANLQNTNLVNANLQNTDLTDTKFNEFTILPDGTNWTSETDMSRFTDPNHPQFWRSDIPDSPSH